MTNRFWNPNIHPVIKHPPTLIRLLFRFWNPLKKWMLPKRGLFIGLMKGGLSVGCRLKILHNVRRRLGNETVSVGLKWSVKCRISNSECQCRPTLILGWMSVPDGKNGLVSGVGNTPFMGPISAEQLYSSLKNWERSILRFCIEAWNNILKLDIRYCPQQNGLIDLGVTITEDDDLGSVHYLWQPGGRRIQGGAKIWVQALLGGGQNLSACSLRGAKFECNTLQKHPLSISFSKNFAADAVYLFQLYWIKSIRLNVNELG